MTATDRVMEALDGEMTAGEIAERLRLNRFTVSSALRRLQGVCKVEVVRVSEYHGRPMYHYQRIAPKFVDTGCLLARVWA